MSDLPFSSEPTSPAPVDNAAADHSPDAAGLGDQPAEGSAPAPASWSPKAGDLVVHHWNDGDGDHERHGLVVEVLSDPDVPDRARVAWLPGVSGPLPVDELDQA